MDQDMVLLLRKIKRILRDCDTLGLLPSEIADDAQLDSLGVDSIDLAMVFTEFEREYDIFFDNEDIAAEYETLMDVACAIRTKLSDRAGG